MQTKKNTTSQKSRNTKMGSFASALWEKRHFDSALDTFNLKALSFDQVKNFTGTFVLSRCSRNKTNFTTRRNSYPVTTYSFMTSCVIFFVSELLCKSNTHISNKQDQNCAIPNFLSVKILQCKALLCSWDDLWKKMEKRVDRTRALVVKIKVSCINLFDV